VKRAAGFDPDFGTATQALAFVTLTEDQAMARAAEADAALAKKKPCGRLHGLPIVVKDVFATQDVRTTSGSKSLEKHTPKEDAAVVARLKAAGAVTAEGPRPYGEMSKWISFATLTGCPATVAPVGRTKGGLPVGIQIMGPYLEDATPIDIATKLAAIMGGFVPPPALGAGKS
jgi:Asp-tRNA(Asn)/Glu-tRNA(Gln) amidotransferase A subunit family amidase